MDNVIEAEEVSAPEVEGVEDEWELDIKACRIDGHAMMDGELCEACQ